MKQTFKIMMVLMVLVASVTTVSAQIPPAKRVTVGYVEYVSIPKVDAILKAKMDTGAKTSSIHANIIEIKKRKKNESDSGYVIFTIQTEDGASNSIKKPITRFVKIKLKDGGFQRRPVVEMKFCIAGVMVHDEVNLSDRDDFLYDVLIGRNMLVKGGLLVDAARDLSVKPNCIDDDEKAATLKR